MAEEQYGLMQLQVRNPCFFWLKLSYECITGSLELTLLDFDIEKIDARTIKEWIHSCILACFLASLQDRLPFNRFKVSREYR